MDKDRGVSVAVEKGCADRFGLVDGFFYGDQGADAEVFVEALHEIPLAASAAAGLPACVAGGREARFEVHLIHHLL
ncbi:MAG: hypothetical protein ACP5SH_25325, partial [Syntrophobacteraceae bacterium]